ncbi:hypothetical protein GCM10023209_05160 [Roseibacterium beibuensis]|uniref:Transposase n=1 Tax=[Roseibacterium] beibuensis TaxID=1193142 RepID=A0ABP9KUZ3_9RHOB
MRQPDPAMGFPSREKAVTAKYIQHQPRETPGSCNRSTPQVAADQMTGSAPQTSAM